MNKDIELRRRRAEEAALVPRPEDGLSLAEQMPLHDMFSFRYSCTEVFSQDGNMHVRMKQTQYRNGRLRTEECEGTVDRDAAERMLLQAQQQFLTQAFGFARLLLAPFLPRSR